MYLSSYFVNASICHHQGRCTGLYLSQCGMGKGVICHQLIELEVAIRVL